MGLASGIKPSGTPDLAIVATTDHAPVVRHRRLHLQSRRRRAGADQPHPPPRRPGVGGRPQLRQRQRRHRRGGPPRRAAHGASSPPSHWAAYRATCSSAPPGLIGIPMRMDPVESGIPKLARCAHRRRRGRRGRGYRDPHHRHRAQGDGPAGRVGARCRRHHRGHGQGRRDALAGDGHDAGGAHHRRRRRPRAPCARC